MNPPPSSLNRRAALDLDPSLYRDRYECSVVAAELPRRSGSHGLVAFGRRLSLRIGTIALAMAGCIMPGVR